MQKTIASVVEADADADEKESAINECKYNCQLRRGCGFRVLMGKWSANQ
jgi:hypothetical protein